MRPSSLKVNQTPGRNDYYRSPWGGVPHAPSTVPSTSRSSFQAFASLCPSLLRSIELLN